MVIFLLIKTIAHIGEQDKICSTLEPKVHSMKYCTISIQGCILRSAASIIHNSIQMMVTFHQITISSTRINFQAKDAEPSSTSTLSPKMTHGKINSVSQASSSSTLNSRIFCMTMRLSYTSKTTTISSRGIQMSIQKFSSTTEIIFPRQI